MQFRVPQFLDIEDKVFGPFTFPQFVYLAGGAGLCFVVYKLIGLLFGLIPILAIAGFAVALAYYRPNDKPFINMVESALKYFSQDKLYLWKRRKAKRVAQSAKKETAAAKKAEEIVSQSKLSGSKLRDLSWSLDVLDLKKEPEGS